MILPAATATVSLKHTTQQGRIQRIQKEGAEPPTLPPE